MSKSETQNATNIWPSVESRPNDSTTRPIETEAQSQEGVIVPATPAMANEDIPDSLQSVPPPVPACPPPED